MDAAAVLERLSARGVTVTPQPNGNLWLEPVSKIPSDLLDLVREHKGSILARLTGPRLHHQPTTKEPICCRARVCDDANGGGAPCGACNGRSCGDCGGCLRASQLWRETERCAKFLDSSLDTILDRLRKGSRWLRGKARRGADDRELYLEMFETWAELQEVLRGITGLWAAYSELARAVSRTRR